MHKKMKKLIFDTGPIITLSLNNLLWIIQPLKKKSGCRFIIPGTVKQELVDKPLKIKRFKFEAMQTMQYLKSNTIEIIKNRKAEKLTSEFLELANHCFKAKGEWITLVHYAEMEALSLAIIENASALIIDERTTRMLIEDAEKLKDIMEHKLHTQISINKDYLKRFNKKVKGLRILRSIELVTIAYEIGLLDRYLVDIPDARKHLLDSVLWGVKLNGCSVSKRDIEKIIKIEKTRL